MRRSRDPFGPITRGAGVLAAALGALGLLAALVGWPGRPVAAAAVLAGGLALLVGGALTGTWPAGIAPAGPAREPAAREPVVREPVVPAPPEPASYGEGADRSGRQELEDRIATLER